MTEQDTHKLVDVADDFEAALEAARVAYHGERREQSALPVVVFRRLCPPLAWLEAKWNNRPTGARLWEMHKWLR